MATVVYNIPFSTIAPSWANSGVPEGTSGTIQFNQDVHIFFSTAAPDPLEEGIVLLSTNLYPLSSSDNLWVRASGLGCKLMVTDHLAAASGGGGGGGGEVTGPGGAALATAARQDAANANLQRIDDRTPDLGQAIMADSTPVAIASDQSPLPFLEAFDRVPFAGVTGTAVQFLLDTMTFELGEGQGQSLCVLTFVQTNQFSNFNVSLIDDNTGTVLPFTTYRDYNSLLPEWHITLVVQTLKASVIRLVVNSNMFDPWTYDSGFGLVGDSLPELYTLGIFNDNPVTLQDGQTHPLLMDQNGRLRVNIGGGLAAFSPLYTQLVDSNSGFSLGGGAKQFTESLSVNQNGGQEFVWQRTAPALDVNLLTGNSAHIFFSSNVPHKAMYVQLTGGAGVSTGAVVFEESGSGAGGSSQITPMYVEEVLASGPVVVTGPITLAAGQTRFFRVAINLANFRIRVTTAFTGGNVRAEGIYHQAPLVPLAGPSAVYKSSQPALANGGRTPLLVDSIGNLNVNLGPSAYGTGLGNPLITTISDFAGSAEARIGIAGYENSLSVCLAGGESFGATRTAPVINYDLFSGSVNGYYQNNSGAFHRLAVQVSGGAGISAGAISFEQTTEVSGGMPFVRPMQVEEMTENGPIPVLGPVTIAANTTRVFVMPIDLANFRARVSTAFVGGDVTFRALLSQTPHIQRTASLFAGETPATIKEGASPSVAGDTALVVAVRPRTAPSGSAFPQNSAVIAGGVAQEILAQNVNRKSFQFQNTSAGVLWICFGGDAAANVGFSVAAGEMFRASGEYVHGGAVSVFGLTIAQTFAYGEM